MGEMIKIAAAASDESFAAYLSEPEPASANGKAVVVLQEWWGLVDHIKDVADRFAKAGFVALAPDLYHGESTTNPDDAGRMLMALNIERAALDLAAAARELKRRAGINHRVGVVGFCMGGQLALLAATAAPEEVGAAVNFYGIHPKVEPDFSKLSCPVLGLFAENDTSVPKKSVDAMVAAIESVGKTIEHHIFPGTDHAFFNDTRPEVYSETAAADAWARTTKFFETHLE